MPDALGVKISGTGHFLPARILDNKHFERIVDTSDEWIRERTGIIERHVVSEGESTATLATEAARRALADASLTPADIDAIIVATITPEFYFPSTACYVQNALGARDVAAFDLSAACSGFIYAFITASSLLGLGRFRHVLVIGSETMSRITDYEDRGSCILFGDGAGAVVLSALPRNDGPALLHYRLHAQGAAGVPVLWVPAGGSRLPASQMTVDERLHYIKMQGREVYKLAVKKNHEMVEETLAEAGILPSQLDLVIPHQSNLRIIESATERLRLPKEKVFTNIQRCGNTSAASIPIGLDECRKSGRIKSGNHVMFVAFGAGYAWGSALLRI